MPEKTEAILIHLEYIREIVDDLKAGQKEQNGRLRTVETDIIELRAGAAQHKSQGRNWGAGAGAAGGFLGGFIATLLTKLGGGGQ